jgi:hypothetical protein
VSPAFWQAARACGVRLCCALQCGWQCGGLWGSRVRPAALLLRMPADYIVLCSFALPLPYFASAACMRQAALCGFITAGCQSKRHCCCVYLLPVLPATSHFEAARLCTTASSSVLVLPESSVMLALLAGHHQADGRALDTVVLHGVCSLLHAAWHVMQLCMRLWHCGCSRD